MFYFHKEEVPGALRIINWGQGWGIWGSQERCPKERQLNWNKKNVIGLSKRKVKVFMQREGLRKGPMVGRVGCLQSLNGISVVEQREQGRCGQDTGLGWNWIRQPPRALYIILKLFFILNAVGSHWGFKQRVRKRYDKSFCVISWIDKVSFSTTGTLDRD